VDAGILEVIAERERRRRKKERRCRAADIDRCPTRHGDRRRCAVAAVLGSDNHPSDGAVMRALSLVLSERGEAVGDQYFTSIRRCMAPALGADVGTRPRFFDTFRKTPLSSKAEDVVL
jgi:hypothetical protein